MASRVCVCRADGTPAFCPRHGFKEFQEVPLPESSGSEDVGVDPALILPNLPSLVPEKTPEPGTEENPIVVPDTPEAPSKAPRTAASRRARVRAQHLRDLAQKRFAIVRQVRIIPYYYGVRVTKRQFSKMVGHDINQWATEGLDYCRDSDRIIEIGAYGEDSDADTEVCEE